MLVSRLYAICDQWWLTEDRCWFGAWLQKIPIRLDDIAYPFGGRVVQETDDWSLLNSCFVVGLKSLLTWNDSDMTLWRVVLFWHYEEQFKLCLQGSVFGWRIQPSPLRNTLTLCVQIKCTPHFISFICRDSYTYYYFVFLFSLREMPKPLERGHTTKAFTCLLRGNNRWKVGRRVTGVHMSADAIPTLLHHVYKHLT